jgi:hypothetical protein
VETEKLFHHELSRIAPDWHPFPSDPQ